VNWLGNWVGTWLGNWLGALGGETLRRLLTQSPAQLSGTGRVLSAPRYGRGALRSAPPRLAGRARVIPYALTVRARNARLLALLD
jgi:hypothetical protein